MYEENATGFRFLRNSKEFDLSINNVRQLFRYQEQDTLTRRK